MKIYSDEITEVEVRAVFNKARRDHDADIWIEEMRGWNPRTCKYGVEVWAESLGGKRATGRNQSSYGRDREPRAASWDDWGYVIAELYNIDPDARIGFYDNEASFVTFVRKYPHKGASLAFLGALRNINSYGGTNG